MRAYDEELMREAAERSLVEDICMFCGEETESLTPATDWDGNEGRACPTCRDDEDDDDPTD